MPPAIIRRRVVSTSFCAPATSSVVTSGPRAGVHPHEKFQHGRTGKLGRAAESAPLLVEGLPKEGETMLQRGGIEFCLARAGTSGELLQHIDRVRALAQRPIPILPPDPGQRSQDRRETRPSPAILRRKIRAAVERREIRRQPRTQRPTAAAGRRLDKCHVDAVDIRPLLAVHLDADVVLVEQRRDVMVLERLVRHDMAPVARRITN